MEIRPIIQKEDTNMLEYNKEDMSPTFSTIMDLERKEGLEQGLKQGREEGLEEGLEEGRLVEKEEIARKSLNKNLDIDFIVELTGLSIERILEIKQTNDL